MVAERFGTDHHEFVVRPNAVDLVEKLVWHHDQPFGDSSAIPTYLLGELTRGHVTVALGGDGGDELLAGYERFAASLAVGVYDAIPASAAKGLRDALGALPQRCPPWSRRQPRALHGRRRARDAGAYLELVSFIDEPSRQALLAHPDPWARARFRAARGSPRAASRRLTACWI